MTLRCKCGGAVEIQEGTDPDDGPPYIEYYHCLSCGRSGTYVFGADSERMTGCLTTTEDQYATF